jgi:hypothetical protein
MEFSLASSLRQRVSNVTGQTDLEREHFGMHTVLSCQFCKWMVSCNVRVRGSSGGRMARRARLISAQIKGIA